jgi:hypothetical protein
MVSNVMKLENPNHSMGNSKKYTKKKIQSKTGTKFN